jgi:Domain of Unknown Function (DUF1206)
VAAESEPPHCAAVVDRGLHWSCVFPPSWSLPESARSPAPLIERNVLERFARAVVRGLLHLTIGCLAIRIAVGSGGGNADQSGALTRRRA